MKELKDKNCFITGAASGIGRSFAIALAKEGMNLFITDINMNDLDKAKTEIEDLGVKVIAGKCDVSKYEDFEKIAEEFYSKLGDVDLLINNAGIGVGGPIEEIELEDWRKTIDVNLWSIIYSIKVFLPRMIKKGSGHIVNVASIAGIIGSAEPLPYITTKFAVVGMSEGLYGSLSRRGINVSVILPSYVKTNIFDSDAMKFSKNMEEKIDKQKLEKIKKSIMEEMASKASSPDRVVRKFIKGIKENKLYILDNYSYLAILAQKATTPEKYEVFLKNLNLKFFETFKNHFSKFDINLDDYL